MALETGADALAWTAVKLGGAVEARDLGIVGSEAVP